MTAGLLYQLSSVDPSVTSAAFNEWYEQHAADRLQYSGILSARRFQALDEELPGHLAFYEVDNIVGLDTPAYKSVAPRDKEAELKMVKQVCFDRRVYAGLKIPLQAGTKYLQVFETPDSVFADKIAEQEGSLATVYTLRDNRKIIRLQAEAGNALPYIVVVGSMEEPTGKQGGRVFKLLQEVFQP